MTNRYRIGILLACLAATLFAVAGYGLNVYAAAAEQPAVEQEAPSGLGPALRTAGLGIGAALAIGLAGLATARVQAAVGAGATGTLAEKPDLFANLFILYAIPETIVVFGLVVAIMLLNKI